MTAKRWFLHGLEYCTRGTDVTCGAILQALAALDETNPLDEHERATVLNAVSESLAKLNLKGAAPTASLADYARLILEVEGGNRALDTE